MKHIKTYKLFESITELESINWELPWKENWEIVKGILNRISLKIRKKTYANERPNDSNLEWINKKLCLRREFWEKGIKSWLKTEEFYEDFIDFITDMNDESDVEVEFENLSAISNKWTVRWRIKEKLNNDEKSIDKVESHEVLGTMKLVGILERGFKACNVSEKDVKWKILSKNTGKGYAEFFIYVEFIVR
jgi:hypothetical protein